MKELPSTEERIWSILAHLSALAFGMGIALPIVGWSEQRRKSRYASFQCLQALGYQSLGYTIWLLSYLVLVILLLIVLALALELADQNGTPPGTMNDTWAWIFVSVLVGWFILYLLFPILAAVACALGKDFRYPMLGNRLAKYLDHQEASTQAPTLNVEHEERWVAGMSHFSVIIVFWGLLAPITAWILQGRQSAFLKFQSIQTTAYQILVNILYVAALGITWLGTIPLFAMTGLEGDPNQTSPLAIAGLVLFLLSMLVALGMLLVLPLFHILGQWAGYRVLKGFDYRYPLIGRLVDRWLARS